MTHKHCFEALDRSLRDIMRFSENVNHDQPFGGKFVVFDGDFRQILPVVPKGNKADIVHASVCSSDFWFSCKEMKMTVKIDLELSSDILITDASEAIAAIVHNTFPSFRENFKNSDYLQERAILAPTHEIVEIVNDFVMSLIPNPETVYLSSDEISKDEGNTEIHEIYSTEFLNSIKCSGLPNHELKLKGVSLRSGSYGYDDISGLRVRAEPSITGLTSGISNRGYAALEDPILTGQTRSASMRISPIPPMPLVNADAVYERPDSQQRVNGLSLPQKESNILLVDGLPTDCTRREVGRILFTT
ncbi:hypothetical protein KSS87_008599 [Heliosperma pusillum]|nr:hypothetical protein KSS87_008599 [Heliosperma pusillum]